MGVDIGTKRISVSMGYGSFLTFRTEVAKAFSDEFGQKYRKYIDDSLRAYTCFLNSDTELARLDKEFNSYLKTVDIDDDVVDFLFQPDSEGKITYKTARKVRDLCRKSKCKNKFGYVSDQRSMTEMAEIFDAAVKHRCNVRWS